MYREPFVEVVYCDNCTCKIAGPGDSGAAFYSEDGKSYCVKCAPLFKYTSSELIALPRPDTAKIEGAATAVGLPSVLERAAEKIPAKFYFCEKCGKRVT